MPSLALTTNHAVEILRSNPAIYPDLIRHPEITVAARRLVEAAQARASLEVREELAEQLCDVLKNVRYGKPPPSQPAPTDRAKDRLQRAEKARQRAAHLKELQRRLRILERQSDAQGGLFPEAPDLDGPTNSTKRRSND